MRLWGTRRFISAAIATVALAAVLASAGSAAAAPVPTSVTMFTGSYNGGTFTAFVAVQKLSGGATGLAGLVTGLPAGKADLALVPNGTCGSPRGHELLRLHIPSGSAFDLRGQATGSVGSSTSLALFFSDYKQVVCLKAAAFARTGAVMVLRRGSASVGVVAMKRNGFPIDLLGMSTTQPPPVTGSFRVNSAPCTTAPTAANRLLQGPLFKLKKFFYADVTQTEFAKFNQAKSLGVTFGAGSTAQPIGCAKFESADLNALKG